MSHDYDVWFVWFDGRETCDSSVFVGYITLSFWVESNSHSSSRRLGFVSAASSGILGAVTVILAALDP